jgi:hypothetical protein
MTNAERQALREKHHATPYKNFCRVCRELGGYVVSYPCDVIKVLDYLDVVEPMPQDINLKGGK